MVKEKKHGHKIIRPQLLKSLRNNKSNKLVMIKVRLTNKKNNKKAS